MSRSIRDIFSSTTKGAALGAMILGSVASPFSAAADDAAINHPGATEITYAQNELAQAKKSIRVNDSRRHPKDGVRTITARASNDRIAIALYGADADMLNQVRLAAYQAKQRGVNIVGIVMGPTDEAKSFDVYADGQRTTTDFNLNYMMERGLTIHRVAESTIEDAHEFLQEVMTKQRQVAALAPVALTQDQ